MTTLLQTLYPHTHRLADDAAPAVTLPDADSELAQALSGLEWKFSINKEARQSWADMPVYYRRMVIGRLFEIGQGR